MSKWFKKAALVVAAALTIGAVASESKAVIVYDATSQTGSRYNPGISTDDLTTPVIALDDVFIPDSFVGSVASNPSRSIFLNSVAVGIRRVGTTAAPTAATTVSIYLAPMLSDPTFTFIPGTPTLVGSGNLGSITTSTTTLLTLTFPPLSQIDLNGSVIPGFNGFYVGVSFSNPNTTNGWRVVNNNGLTTNGFSLWDNGSFSSPLDGPFIFGTGVPSDFMIRIDASPIPEPSALGLLAPAAMLLGRRRK